MNKDQNMQTENIESTADWRGYVEHLHLCPRAFLPMRAFNEITLIAGKGIYGDRYMNESGFYSHKPEEGRQVTLFSAEELEVMAQQFGVEFAPHEHRRNVTVRGAPLNSLVGKRFWLGEILLECTRLSVPCRHIEEVTGKSVFDAMIGRSGINCRILIGGVVRIGDQLRPAEDEGTPS